MGAYNVIIIGSKEGGGALARQLAPQASASSCVLADWLPCEPRELDNLYVVAASFFVSIGAVNPCLTAIGNAIRIGDHLLQRLS